MTFKLIGNELVGQMSKPFPKCEDDVDENLEGTYKERLIQNLSPSPISKQTNMENNLECKLSNNELIQASREWISKLCNSGGKAWTLRIPVDLERDPDILFSELCNRLESLSAHTGDSPKAQSDEDQEALWDNFLQGVKDNMILGNSNFEIYEMNKEKYKLWERS